MKRQSRLQVWLTDEEQRVLEREAHRYGTNKSGLVRHVLRERLGLAALPLSPFTSP